MDDERNQDVSRNEDNNNPMSRKEVPEEKLQNRPEPSVNPENDAVSGIEGNDSGSIENTYPEEPQNEEYYTSTGKKVGDFCIGFFGALAANVISTAVPIIGNLAVTIAGIILGIHFMRKTNRRLIGIGILIPTILSAVVLLLVGGCFLVVFTSFR